MHTFVILIDDKKCNKLELVLISFVGGINADMFATELFEEFSLELRHQHQ